LKRKYLAVGIILLFIGTCIIPSATSGLTNGKRPTNGKNIITVDDEPGDADFTSIKEAVNYSSPGDIIEVYSGTYPEDGIRIVKENIRLLGISHELGEGNDSGKPFVKGGGSASVIQLIASNVTVSNFIIENSWSDYSCIRVGTDWPDELYNITISDCIISDCIIRNSSSRGISVSHMGHITNIIMINNQISHCNRYGIYVESVYNPVVYTIEGDFIISGNVITDCRDIGIYFLGDRQNISGNRIKRCKIGMHFRGAKNIIYGNDIESCSVGIYDYFVLPRINEDWVGGHTNIITKNNFKNYSRSGMWWLKFPSFIIMILNKFRKEGWKENYWDTWSGVGPKLIPGVFVLGEYIILPWFNFDWHPAREPYDVGV